MYFPRSLESSAFFVSSMDENRTKVYNIDKSIIDKATIMNITLHQLLFRAYHGQSNMLQPVFEELGLGRGQPKILKYLLSFGESSQNDIASYFNVDPASISRMAEILQKKGFIERVEDSGCRRANKLSLTEKGRASAIRWNEECRKVEAVMLSGFTKEEEDNLSSYLKRIIDNFKKEENA